MNRSCTRLREPAGQLGPPAHRIDDQVGAQLLPRIGSHTGHVRNAVVRADHQLCDGDPALHLQARLGLRDTSHCLLEHCSASGDRLKALIPIAPRRIREKG